MLNMLEADELKHPTTLNPQKYHFGKLYRELYLVWRDVLRETNIEFDLLYDPVGWITLLNSPDILNSNRPLLYIPKVV